MEDYPYLYSSSHFLAANLVFGLIICYLKALKQTEYYTVQKMKRKTLYLRTLRGGRFRQTSDYRQPAAVSMANEFFSGDVQLLKAIDKVLVWLAFAELCLKGKPRLYSASSLL